MFESDELSIDCATCIGSGTTACTDCVVTYLVANDDGPIDVVSVRLPGEALPGKAQPAELPPHELAIERLARAGLLDSPPQFVSVAEFESHGAERRSLSVVR